MLKTLKTALIFMWIGAGVPRLKAKLICSGLSGIFIGLFTYLFPYYLSNMVKAINERNQSAVLQGFYALVLVTVCLWLTKFLWRYYCERTTNEIPLRLKQFYYGQLFKKSYHWHLKNSVGYFTVALEQVCQNLHNWLARFPLEYISSIVIYGLFLTYTCTISPLLFVYFVVCFIAMVVILRCLYNKQLRYIEAFVQASVKFGKSFVDFLYNIRSVRKMNLFEFTNNQLTQKRLVVRNANRNYIRYNAFLWGIMEALVAALFLLPVWYYILQFIKTGQGIEIIVMITAIQPRIEQMGRQIMHFMSEVARAEAEYDVLSKHLNKQANESHGKLRPDSWQEIRFNHSLFQYIKDDTVFSHYVPEFSIRPGDHVAITGKSGEGKSTFLNLLTGQFPVIDGRITVDENSYTDLSPAFFADKMAYISQDVELFDMSLYDNIVLGATVSNEQLQRIIDGCCLNKLIERMGGNWHTEIGEKGVQVSAGEKQRINLARGLLLNRDILILDEVTANLDPSTTHKIWDFIFKEYADKTIIAVSHEAELIEHVNRELHFSHGIGREKSDLASI